MKIKVRETKWGGFVGINIEGKVGKFNTMY